MIREVLAHDSDNCQQDQQRRLYCWADEILSAARINIAFIADTIWSRKSAADDDDDGRGDDDRESDDRVVGGVGEDTYRRLNRSLWIRTCKIDACYEKITTLSSRRGGSTIQTRKRRRVRDVIPESRLAIYGDYEYTGGLSGSGEEAEEMEEAAKGEQRNSNDDQQESVVELQEPRFTGRMDHSENGPIPPIESVTNGNDDRVVVVVGSGYKEEIDKNDDDGDVAKESWQLDEIEDYIAKINRMSSTGSDRRRRQRLETPMKCDKSDKDSRNSTTSEQTTATTSARKEMKQQATFSDLECDLPPAMRFSVNNVSEAQLEGRIFNETVRNLWKTSSNDHRSAASANFYPYQDYNNQLHQQQQQYHHHQHHHHHHQQQQQQQQYLTARNLRQSQMELQRELSLLKPITTTTTSCNQLSISSSSGNNSNCSTRTTTIGTAAVTDSCNNNGNAVVATPVDMQHTHCSFQSERLRMSNRCPYSYVVDSRPGGNGSSLGCSLGVDVPEFFPQQSSTTSNWMDADQQSVKDQQQQQQLQQLQQQAQLQYYPQPQMDSVYSDELIHYKAAQQVARKTTVAMYQNTLVPMVATPIVNAVVWPTVPASPWVRASLLPAASIQLHHQIPQNVAATGAGPSAAAQIQLQQQQQQQHQQQQQATRPPTLAQVVHRPIRTPDLAQVVQAATIQQQPLQRSTQAQKASSGGGGGGVTQIPVYQRANKPSASEYQRRKNQGVDYNNLILLTKSAMKVRRSQTKATKKSFVDTAKLQQQHHQTVAPKTSYSGAAAAGVASSCSTPKWLEKGQQQPKREREYVTISTGSSAAAAAAAVTSSSIEKTPALSTCSVSTEEDDEIAATASSFYHHKKSNKQQQPQQQRQPVTTKKRLYRDVLENLPRQVIPVSETMSDGSFERRYDELEKQAMEQYRTSEECLALRYQELEQQALEQYKAIEGSESMINLEHDRRSQASTRSSSQRGGACSDQDDKLSLCSNNSSVSSSTTDGQATGGGHQQQQQYSSYARATTSSSSSFSNNSNNYAKRSGSSSGDARGKYFWHIVSLVLYIVVDHRHRDAPIEINWLAREGNNHHFKHSLCVVSFFCVRWS
ncbi:hypothetical protein TKK_0006286 [Trichogramma kaykai]|uniref:Uncharacterized protein n=1 Tax=Trichogramma kaykai TaxID=54128 RepID=A0ABD2XFP2_9HYME